jgi:hypothetical protein
MSDEKKPLDGPLGDPSLERQTAASGQPAPTFEEAVAELRIMTKMLAEHPCPTTRDLIAAASICVDVAQKDSHSSAVPRVTDFAQKWADETFVPMVKALRAESLTYEDAKERIKFLARFTSVLFYTAREFGVLAFQEAEKYRATEGGVVVKPKLTDKPPTGWIN